MTELDPNYNADLLDAMADMAYELYVQREVLLVQKKIDFKVYEYQAVKI